MGGRPGGLRSSQDAVQPLREVGGEGRLGRPLPVSGFGRRPTGGSPSRQFGGQSASLCERRKRGECNQAIGRSRGGRTTKIHALSDSEGRPLAFLLTGGQVADCRAGEALLEGLEADAIVHADRGYDSDAIRRQIEAAGSTPNIPPKTNRRWKPCFSPFLYRGRNAIERMFGRLKDFRRIATRYDKLARNFLAAVCIAATIIYWL